MNEQSSGPETANQHERLVAKSFVDLVRELTDNKENNRVRYTYNGRPTLLVPAVVEVSQMSDESDFFTIQAGLGDREDPEITVTYGYQEQLTDDIVAAQNAGKELIPDTVELAINGQSLNGLVGDERQRALETVTNTVTDLRAQLTDSYQIEAPATV